jgi:hypothetical protein
VYVKGVSPAVVEPHDDRSPIVRKLATARTVLRQNGAAGVGKLAWNKAVSAGEFTVSAAKARLAGEANRWFLRRTPIR